MATSKQEQLYNEIIEYYGFADRLLAALEESDHELASKQFHLLEELTSKLEECADILTTRYIEFVKNGNSEKISEEIRKSLNEIEVKITECKNKTLMLNTQNH
jgi:hypothetical protein